MRQAPDFNLPDQQGEMHQLADYAGRWLVLYFYPQDETPGCTAEACAFRDGREDIRAAGAEIVGISNDSVDSHKQFADKHQLNFTILSDESGDTIKHYGSWGERLSQGNIVIGTQRKTFLIDPNGQIVQDYPDVTPATHPLQVLSDLKTLQADDLTSR